MLTRDGGPFAVRFDVAASPLGDPPITNAVYMHGYDPLTMALLCDGWIYTKPLGEYEPVTYLENWIHEGNVERVRAMAMNPRWRTYSVEQFDQGCQSYIADHRRNFEKLKLREFAADLGQDLVREKAMTRNLKGAKARTVLARS